MSNTIIIGDIAEGQKWFGQAEFLKQQLVSIYNRTNQNMSTWKQVNADVKIFIKMINGHPQAFIYTEGGYEFTVPIGYINWEDYIYTGLDFYNGVETSPAKILKNANTLAVPYNVWYSLNGYVTNGAAARYRNIFQKVNVDYIYTYVGPSRVYFGGTTESYKSSSLASASAIAGKYLWYIQPGGTSTKSIVFVEDMTSQQIVFSGYIAGEWITNASNDKDAKGFWSFNRAGDKACSVVWVRDAERFGTTQPPSQSTPTIGEFNTSYVIEIGLILDGDGNFAGIQKLREGETEDFCIAADYDWTTEENELVIATLYGFDYRFGKAILATETSISNGDILGEVGDHFYTVYTAVDKVRPRQLYELISIADYGLGVRAQYNNIKSQHSAIDIWLKVATADGTLIQALELTHNIDVKTKESSTGTWYEGGGSSFINYISGLDLRIRGITAYSSNGGVYVTAYGKEWSNGTNLQSSGDQVPTSASNFYIPDTLYAPIKIMMVPQTIAAIPHLKTEPWEIRNLCVYAPCIINEETGDTDPNKALDFRIDTQTEQSAATAFQEGYHRKVYELTNTEAPYLNRYFTTGAWAKKKERK